MQRHMQGIQFRERNAGPQIDRNMKDEGKSSASALRHTGAIESNLAVALQILECKT